MHVPNPDIQFGPITLTECSNTLRKTDTFRSQSQLESLRRTFWRGDASDAGEDKKEQSIGDDSQTRNQSDGSGSDDESELRKDNKKKHVDFLVSTTAAWSLDRGGGDTGNGDGKNVSSEKQKANKQDDVTLTLVISKREPTKQEVQFKKGVVQDNRHDNRVFNPGRAMGARLFIEDQVRVVFPKSRLPVFPYKTDTFGYSSQGRLLSGGRPHRASVFRNRPGLAAGETVGNVLGRGPKFNRFIPRGGRVEPGTGAGRFCHGPGRAVAVVANRAGAAHHA